jgi:opacity protein-like surface antigen
MVEKLCIAVAAALLATPAVAQDAITPNSAPREGWQYGHGNNYTPSNTLLDATAVAQGDELALRIHQTGEVAPASNGNVYSFALGLPTDQYSFDWDLGQFNHGADSALITLTNIGTGQTFSYNPFAVGNDNTAAYDALTGSYSSQNSFRFNWAPIGFNAAANSSYSVNLSTSLGGNTQYSLTAIAQFGSGANAGVPEPATWAMMLFGFGGIGLAARRKQAPARAQIA